MHNAAKLKIPTNSFAFIAGGMKNVARIKTMITKENRISVNAIQHKQNEHKI